MTILALVLAAAPAWGQTSNPNTEPQTVSANADPSDSELQSQIQKALRNEPTLASESVKVSVSDEEIDLSGSVATAKERLTAQRIAQSYAGNRKVKDQLTLSGHAHASPQ